MAKKALLENEADAVIYNAMVEFLYDALGFVYFVFPWGSGSLLGEEGPDRWQVDVLKAIGNNLRNADKSVRIAVASGHGIGKTALIAWIILWFMSTRAHPQVVVTANTAKQLESKTWRELAKWHRLAANAHWFTHTATKFYINGAESTWFASAVPWNKDKSEAFAGTHEADVLVIYDEASAIDDIIWEVTEGAMMDLGSLWIAFGNPTQSTGRFHSCFHKDRNRWTRMQIDSRTAKKANPKEIAEWIETYGDDSDFIRVRVKGEFPTASSMQFIPLNIIEAAMSVQLDTDVWAWAPVVIGVDVARFGDDKSVICVRRGLKIIKMRSFQQIDTMTLSSMVVEEINAHNPVAVFIDVVGIGAGVVDRVRQLGYRRIVFEVNAHNIPKDPKKFYNMGAEMWYDMREWLKSGASILNLQELKDDLSGRQYGYDSKGKLQLETKSDMKKRDLPSPDYADAIGFTFAYPVREYRGKRNGSQGGAGYDYDEYDEHFDRRAVVNPRTGY